MKKIIHHRVAMPVEAERLFEMYLDPVIHGAIIGGAVTISPGEGSEFTAFGGMIKGRTIAIVPKKHIVQLWRETDWKPTDPDSIVVLTFLPEGPHGKIELTQLDVPECDFDDVNRGWLDHYWRPWRAYLERELTAKGRRAA